MLGLDRLLLHALEVFLGGFVETLNVDQLKVGVRKGNVSLKDVRLRRDALRKLAGLPVAVESGAIEEVSIHVPWSKLASERVVVVLQRRTWKGKANGGYSREEAS